MKPVSPLFAYAHDGKLFYRAVMKRLNALGNVSLNDFCIAAGIDFSTAWRWNNKGSKPSTDNVNAVEKSLIRLEKKLCSNNIIHSD